jgi:hypothetical protein
MIRKQENDNADNTNDAHNQTIINKMQMLQQKQNDKLNRL